MIGGLVDGWREWDLLLGSIEGMGFGCGIYRMVSGRISFYRTAYLETGQERPVEYGLVIQLRSV